MQVARVEKKVKGLNIGSAGFQRICSSCGTEHSPEWRKGPGNFIHFFNAFLFRWTQDVSLEMK
jgi:hypothetical protein